MSELDLLSLLQSEPGGYVSGERISETLGLSRTAVWKQIQKLKTKGYVFEASPRLGYRLVHIPERFDADKLKHLTGSLRFGTTVHVYDSIDSTQTAAQQLVAMGAEEGTLVVAEEQTKGRGRLGRGWHSPRGKGIWMTLVLKPTFPIQAMTHLTLLLAVALCRAIRSQAGVEAMIKWPNDLLVRGRKISGILLESAAEDERLRYVAAGVGISANLEEADYPGDLREKATSLLLESGRKVDREALVAAFLREAEALYEHYSVNGFGAILALWEALSVTIGQQVRIQAGADQWVEGRAVGLDPFGGLVIQRTSGSSDTERITVYSGDLDHRRTP